MGQTVEVDGVEYDAKYAALLVDRDTRHAILRDLDRASLRRKVETPAGLRAQAVAAECAMLRRRPDQWLDEIESRSASGWAGTLDEGRLQARVIYESMHDGELPRNVRGWRRHHLDMLDREITAGASPLDAACAVWRVDRRWHRANGSETAAKSAMPPLHFDHTEIAGLAEPMIANLRRYEPFFYANGMPMGVTKAWHGLPSAALKTYVAEIAVWLDAHWPSGRAVLEGDTEVPAGYALGRLSVAYAAEAFARMFTIEEAADFVVDQVGQELTRRVGARSSEQMLQDEMVEYVRGLARAIAAAPEFAGLLFSKGLAVGNG